jgi:hypothetical protein
LQKTPCGVSWAGGCGLGRIGPFGQGEKRERKGAEPREERRVLSLFFFRFFCFSFQIQFSNLFKFCLKLNFAREVINTHGLVE